MTLGQNKLFEHHGGCKIINFQKLKIGEEMEGIQHLSCLLYSKDITGNLVSKWGEFLFLETFQLINGEECYHFAIPNELMSPAIGNNC